MMGFQKIIWDSSVIKEGSLSVTDYWGRAASFMLGVGTEQVRSLFRESLEGNLET